MQNSSYIVSPSSEHWHLVAVDAEDVLLLLLLLLLQVLLPHPDFEGRGGRPRRFLPPPILKER